MKQTRGKNYGNINGRMECHSYNMERRLEFFGIHIRESEYEMVFADHMRDHCQRAVSGSQIFREARGMAEENRKKAD